MRHRHTPEPWQFDLIPRDNTWPGLFQVETNILTYGMDGEEGIYINNPVDGALIKAAPEMLVLLRSVSAVHTQAEAAHHYDATVTAIRALLRRLEG